MNALSNFPSLTLILLSSSEAEPYHRSLQGETISKYCISATGQDVSAAPAESDPTLSVWKRRFSSLILSDVLVMEALAGTRGDVTHIIHLRR